METVAVTCDSLKLARTHYENFPVASILLPRHLREPIALIYAFARQADDFADEGDLPPE
ncbi:MAG: squalene/phytoene synthase family protein, partial [Methylobacillus sp.]|nr:squalene/phytoene synthase family protein [Methylobacillus sp.]